MFQLYVTYRRHLSTTWKAITIQNIILMQEESLNDEIEIFELSPSSSTIHTASLTSSPASLVSTTRPKRKTSHIKIEALDYRSKLRSRK